jgi:hypothetical protein
MASWMPCVDRRDVLARDTTTGDLVLELVDLAFGGVRAARSRSAPWRTGPTHRSASCGCSRTSRPLADRLAVGHLRLADVGLDLELATHAVDEDVEVQLAHAGDDGLAGLLVCSTWKVGSSSASFWIAVPSFSWSPLVLGSMATWMTGLGKVIDSRTTGLSMSHRVSPVVVSLRPMAA